MQSLTELRPVGILEDIFAAEIFRLVARLECTDLTDAERSSTTISLRPDMAELRYLQTDRRLKLEHNLDLPGLISAKEILRFRKLVAKLAREENSEKLQNEPNSDSVAVSEDHLDALIQDEDQKQMAEFTERTQFPVRRPPGVPRNATCPCHSGKKYKRCCGFTSQNAVHPMARAA